MFITIIAVMAPVLYITSEAGNIAYGAATVSVTALNVRSGPSTTNNIVNTLNHNARIVVLEKTSSDWYHINYRGVDGYVASLYLANVLTAENFNAVGIVTGDSVRMRSGPSTSHSILGTGDNNTIVSIIGINNGWYKVVYGSNTGYIRSDFIDIIKSNTTANAPTSTDFNVEQLTASDVSLRDQLVNYALKYVGYSYVYGGSSPSAGFDCSGLVYYVYRHFDFNVTRTASSQFARDGVTVTKSELQLGDLVFFSSNGGYSVTHVGIYIGNNEFVHASSPKVGTVISSLGSSYYTRVWYGAKRVIS